MRLAIGPGAGSGCAEAGGLEDAAVAGFGALGGRSEKEKRVLGVKLF